MAIPTYDRMLRPILELAAREDITRRVAEDAMREHFQLTEQEMALQTGRDGVVRSRAGRAILAMARSGLITKVAPHTYRITDAGVDFMRRAEGDISPRDLPLMPAPADDASDQVAASPPLGGHEVVGSSNRSDVPEEAVLVALRQRLRDTPLSPADLKECRMLLGWTEVDVADRLLSSVGQVRGLESGCATMFYSQRFFERARDKYIALLHARARGQQAVEPVHPAMIRGLGPAPMPDRESRS